MGLASTRSKTLLSAWKTCRSRTAHAMLCVACKAGPSKTTGSRRTSAEKSFGRSRLECRRAAPPMLCPTPTTTSAPCPLHHTSTIGFRTVTGLVWPRAMKWGHGIAQSAMTLQEREEWCADSDSKSWIETLDCSHFINCVQDILLEHVRPQWRATWKRS